jgi:uncharacterized surface protein with fasciclin (FAS1) repeats
MASQEGTNKDQMVDAGINMKLATHSILDTIAADHDLTKLSDAFQKAGMQGYLDGPDLITLFAPDDGALEPLDTRDTEGLATLLRRHIVARAVTEAELRTSDHIETMEHNTVPISTNFTETLLGKARIVRPDIECTNGVIHVIDHVL